MAEPYLTSIARRTDRLLRELRQSRCTYARGFVFFLLATWLTFILAPQIGDEPINSLLLILAGFNGAMMCACGYGIMKADNTILLIQESRAELAKEIARWNTDDKGARP